MKRILVIDGQGGRLGALLIEELKKKNVTAEIVAVDMTAYTGGISWIENPITITSRADIDELCQLWNGTWAVRTYPHKNPLGFERVVVPQGGSATVYMVFHTVDGGAFSYRSTYYYFYEYNLATEERGDYYTYGPCGLNDALEAFVLSRIEAEVEP